MRKHYSRLLKSFFHEKLFRSRVDLNITQEQMAERLAMANRAYVYLDHGKHSCNAVTLALYLIYVCEDPMAFLEGLRNAFENEDPQEP